MTLLTACQNAAVLLLGRKPDTIFSSTDVFSLEMQVLANEVACDIARSHDWQALVRTHSIMPDGVATTFPLPTDYGRMLLDSEIYNQTNWAWGYTHVTRADDWLRMKVQDFTVIVPSAWTMQGDQFEFLPAPSSSATAKFVYITKNIIKSETNQAKANFTDDEDKFALSERLLTLGLVWRWRELKRLEASTDQANFEKAFAEIAARDGGSKIIRKGGRPIYGDFRIAWPWPLGGV
ncbi:hypothetical protein NN6n1_13230 [Shinella zoogloeoides]